MVLILVAVNFLAGQTPVRLDLTREKAYTLSEGTRAILSKLTGKVTIRFYCSQAQSSTPETVFLKQHASNVEDLLNEYKRASNGKIVIQKLDPQPDSDAEDSAKLDGVEGAPLSDGEKFYLGLAVSQLDAKEAIPFLDPSRERQLEYDLSRAISRVVNPDKAVVGVMTPLQMFGAPVNPMEMSPDQQPPQPWALIKELRQDYSLKQIPMDAEKIDDDVKVLLVVHPKSISEKAQYALDQFILRGGRMAAFLDPQSVVDSHTQPNPMMGGTPPPEGSSLDTLLAAWGLGFDKTKSVADVNLKMQLNGRGGVPQEAPTWLSLTADQINPDDIALGQLDNLWLIGAGAFTGTATNGLKETVLLRSTADSQLVDSMQASMGGASILNDFKPSGQSQALAVRLTGKFKTAFPGGAPGGATNAPAGLKESASENTVVLVGDSDLLNDNFSLRQVDAFGQSMAMAMNGNLNFAENIVEQLSGDSNLITVRSRAALNHPFTRVKAMEAAAAQQYSAEVNELQKSLEDTEQKLGELQAQNKDKSQKFILSAEQQAEVEKFRKQEAETRVKLKQVQKELSREVNSLQTRVTWLNIALVPALVTLFGIGLALYKRKLTAAK